MSGGGGGVHVWRLVRERDAAAWARERLFVVALNAKQKIIGVGEVPPEHLTAAELRKVFRGTSLAQAAALIGVHNQPTANPGPSAKNEVIARQLHAVADQLGVRLLDHLVFCRGRYRSTGGRDR